MDIKRVLVVDDSPTDLHILSEMLTKNGFTVLTAESGEQAIDMAKAEKPDLVIMDIVMPGMSGFEATRSITKGTETSAIPVIIISTKGQETDKVWGMRQGARDYLTKPVDEKALVEKIQSL
jgi:twitching motility two-component system response regulator PilH